MERIQHITQLLGATRQCPKLKTITTELPQQTSKGSQTPHFQLRPATTHEDMRPWEGGNVTICSITCFLPNYCSNSYRHHRCQEGVSHFQRYSDTACFHHFHDSLTHAYSRPMILKGPSLWLSNFLEGLSVLICLTSSYTSSPGAKGGIRRHWNSVAEAFCLIATPICFQRWVWRSENKVAMDSAS